MAAGDQQRRKQERDGYRAAGGGGINNANISGSRIPNASDRNAEQRILATAAKRNAAIEAGHNPADYGYDENFNKTPSYTGRKLPPKPETAAKPLAPGAGVTAPGTGNRVPSLLQPNAGQIRGRINGNDAGAELKRMRAEAEARGEQPFSASKSERDYDAGLARTKEAADRDAAAAAAKPPPSAGAPAKPDAVATPIPLTGPPRSAMNPPGTPPAAPTAPSPGASPGVTGGEAVDVPGGKVMKGLSTLGLETSSIARNVGEELTTRGNRFAKAAGELYPTAQSKMSRLSTLQNRGVSLGRSAAQVTGKLAENRKLLGEALSGGLELERLRKAGAWVDPDLADAASKAPQSIARSIRELHERGGRAATAQAKNVAKLTSASDEAAAAALNYNRINSRASSLLAKGGKAMKVAGVARKLALPLDIALNVVEGGRLIGSEQHRADRAKEFEGYANKGALRSSVESALNPVAGLYSFGHQINEARKSSANAKAAGKSYDAAKAGFDRRQALLAESGVSKEQLRAMPQKERSALLKSIRDRVAAGG
jgi:hypothetical protein